MITFIKDDHKLVSDLAEKAYNAYGNYFGWYWYSDIAIPHWNELESSEQFAWQEVVRSTLTELNVRREEI